MLFPAHDIAYYHTFARSWVEAIRDIYYGGGGFFAAE